MDITGAGTAVMIAIAAALWFAYFVPTWMRRREYLDTERTATRLQQTLRVMAETAELPDQVRVEATSRDAARQERLLAAQRRRADVIAARALELEAKVISDLRRDASADARLGRRVTVDKARRRRAHRLASLLMIAATVTIGIQLLLVVTNAAGSGAWLVFAGGAALGIAGVVVRRRLDARSTRRVPEASVTSAPIATEPAVSARATRTWTPVAVPAPLYLSRPVAQPVRPRMDLATQLRIEALAAEQALRDAHEAPEVVPIRPHRPAAPERTIAPVESPALRPAAASRWASMGRVDGADVSAPDLDEVLRRRRNAG